MPRIISLDLGSKTGWAICYSKGFVLHGTDYFTKNHKIKDISEDKGFRFWKFSNFLSQLFSAGAQRVYYEKVVGHRSSDSAHMYGAFEGILLLTCFYNQIPVVPVYVATIKKYITGRGDATKEDVIAAIKARGYTPETDNDADALALLFYAEEQMGN